MRSLIAALLALALSGCAVKDTFDTVQAIKANPTVQKITEGAEFVCDLREQLTPAQLGFKDVVAAVDVGCDQLKRLQFFGVLPSLPSAFGKRNCAIYAHNGLDNTEGYRRLCGDPLVTLARQALTIYIDAAEALVPGFQAPEIILFNQETTDARLCGDDAISAISACGPQVFLRPAQIREYIDPEVAAVYASGHEVAHVVQYNFDLLDDYHINGAFRELQGDCIFGALSAVYDPTPQEVERAIDTLSAIGDLPTHGTAVQRVAYTSHGLEKGVDACLLLTPSNPLI